MLPEQVSTDSPIVVFISLVWLVSCGVAVWKWKYLSYRLLPFLVATAAPVILGWGNMMVGITAMNIVTAALLFALRLEEILGAKKGQDKNQPAKENRDRQDF